MNLSGLTEAISSEIQAQGAEADVKATEATATNNPPEWSEGTPTGEDGKAKADPKTPEGKSGTDTDKKSGADGWKDDPNEGKPLTEKELEDFKKVWKHYVAYPKYAKTQDKVRELQTEIDKLKSQKSTWQEDEEALKARDELKKMGFIPQDEVEEIQKQKELELAQKEETEAFKESIKALEEKYDGNIAWLPKFELASLQEFMQNENVYNPEGAYILKNLDAYVSYLVEQEIQSRASVPAPVKPGSTQKPSGQEIDLSKVTIGDDSFRDAISSMLHAG